MRKDIHDWLGEDPLLVERGSVATLSGLTTPQDCSYKNSQEETIKEDLVFQTFPVSCEPAGADCLY